MHQSTAFWLFATLFLLLLASCEEEIPEPLEGETIIDNNVVVIDEGDTSGIIAVDSTSVKLSQITNNGESIATGDIIVSGITQKAPLGFLRRVLAIDEDNGDYILQTEQANLDDIIIQDESEFYYSFGPDDVIGKNGAGIYVINEDYNGVVVDLDGSPLTLDDRLELDSYVRLDFDFYLKWKWKKRKLAEIELDGAQAVSRCGDTVADAITARLATHKSLGRSAKQQLGWLKKSEFGKKKLSELSLEALTDFADDMLEEERQPQPDILRFS